MKKPTEIKLGWRIVKIIYKSIVLFNGQDSYGRTDANEGKIEIATEKIDISNSKIKGLLHEILHIINYHYCINLAEKQIEILAIGLGDLAAQNPELIKYIFVEKP